LDRSLDVVTRAQPECLGTVGIEVGADDHHGHALGLGCAAEPFEHGLGFFSTLDVEHDRRRRHAHGMVIGVVAA
jgi:hypothetical protein